MCGIAGLLDAQREEELRARATAMANTLAHRGPDDHGVWIDAEAGVGLGHRRLRIVDLSEHGHQPMVSADGRFVIVYNGELYNYRRLRRELEQTGSRFRGTSDTAVLLEAIAQWGIETALERANGMFAFAVWDRRERELVLARDRFGEKPLYYCWAGRTFLFASELKALRVDPAFRGSLDRTSVALFLRHGFVPGDRSIYEGVEKVPPGTFIRVQPDAGPARALRAVPYWSARDEAERAAHDRVDLGVDEAATEVEAVLGDSVGLRMVADVPLGAFLSGGIDSSLVVALMQAQSTQPVRTFTIGFLESAHDESGNAEQVARHLGTDHTTLTVTPADALAVVPRLPEIYDEPFADSSQVPTFLVAQLTREHVTVSLSGDGGDELFGGYDRYPRFARLARSLGRLPRPARLAAARALRAAPARGIGHKARRLGGALGSGSDAIYRTMMSYWADAPIGANGSGPATLFDDESRWPRLDDPVERVMCHDTLTYLPDDILTKVDRATMAVSLEARVPFLDHRVYELAWRLPRAYKLRDGTGKWLLRRVLHRHVPAALVERPKMGFGVPLAEWLRGPLREWAEDLLAEDRLRREGLFDAAGVRAKWAEHVSGRADWRYDLWNVIMFEAWLQATGP